MAAITGIGGSRSGPTIGFGAKAGPTGFGSGNTPLLSPTADAQLASTVTDVQSLREKAALDAANAQAAQTEAAGYQAQLGAFGNVKAITGNEALISQVSGDILRIQQQQQLAQNLGTQRAVTATAGFKNSGSSLDVLRSSLQQGYLQQQLGETQTSLNVSGYLAQGIATDAEIAAATAAGNSAAALGISYANAGALSTANAANETASLQAYLQNTKLTPAETLTLSPLSANPNSPAPPLQTDANGNLVPVSTTFGAGPAPTALTQNKAGGPPASAYDSNGNLLPGYSSTYTGIGTSGYGAVLIGSKGF